LETPDTLRVFVASLSLYMKMPDNQNYSRFQNIGYSEVSRRFPHPLYENARIAVVMLVIKLRWTNKIYCRSPIPNLAEIRSLLLRERERPSTKSTAFVHSLF
jgi:hypothetical protein